MYVMQLCPTNVERFYAVVKGHIEFVIDIVESAKDSLTVYMQEVEMWTFEGEPEILNPYVMVTLKWDGSSYLDFGRPTDSGGGPTHAGWLYFSGVHSWRKHCEIMEWLYREMSARIEEFDTAQWWGRKAEVF